MPVRPRAEPDHGPRRWGRIPGRAAAPTCSVSGLAAAGCLTAPLPGRASCAQPRSASLDLRGCCTLRPGGSHPSGFRPLCVTVHGGPADGRQRQRDEPAESSPRGPLCLHVRHVRAGGVHVVIALLRRTCVRAQVIRMDERCADSYECPKTDNEGGDDKRLSALKHPGRHGPEYASHRSAGASFAQTVGRTNAGAAPLKGS
jgi:hypothetical protein